MLAATAAEPGNIWQQGNALPATQPNNGLPCHATEKSVAYNLAEAGKAIGVNRSTVLRAIRRGTISATRDPPAGGWLIEPAELYRVFPAVAPESGAATERNGGDATELVELESASKPPSCVSVKRTNRSATCGNGSIPRPRSAAA